MQNTDCTLIHCDDAFTPISPGPSDMAIQPQGPAASYAEITWLDTYQKKCFQACSAGIHLGLCIHLQCVCICLHISAWISFFSLLQFSCVSLAILSSCSPRRQNLYQEVCHQLDRQLCLLPSAPANGTRQV